jgi:hypothetical protein
LNFLQTDLTVSTGVHQYSCAASCSAGTVGGVTTTCCYANADCNTLYKIASCYVGTDLSATSSSCTNSGYCKVIKRIDTCFYFQ